MSKLMQVIQSHMHQSVASVGTSRDWITPGLEISRIYYFFSHMYVVLFTVLSRLGEITAQTLWSKAESIVRRAVKLWFSVGCEKWRERLLQSTQDIKVWCRLMIIQSWNKSTWIALERFVYKIEYSVVWLVAPGWWLVPSPLRHAKQSGDRLARVNGCSQRWRK